MCREEADRVSPPPCAQCLQLICPGTCGRIDGLDGIRILGFYHDPRIRSAIHALKYQGLSAIRGAVWEFVADNAGAGVGPLPWERESGLAIQHLPSTPRRIRERGFDQAAEIADVVRAELGSTDAFRSDILIRRAGTGITQATLPDPTLRAANARGAFAIRPKAIIPSAVLLVDDVITTGATMLEAARLMRSAGVERVYGFAWAVGA